MAKARHGCIRDHLYKDITYDRAAGDDVNEQPRLTIGARFRDSGFKNGRLDDLQIFDTALTPAEVALAAGGKPVRRCGLRPFPRPVSFSRTCRRSRSCRASESRRTRSSRRCRR